MISVKSVGAWGVFRAGLILALLLGYRASAAVTNVYSTQFEAAQGYNINFDLVGQNGWIESGSGGNGLISGSFAGLGQQAYIGFAPPNPNELFLSIWRPINLSPVPINTPIVKFSVKMKIEDSLNGRYDDFYWSVYNSQGNRLFTLDFDNSNFNIYYALDGTNKFVPTGRTFSNGVPYSLLVTMDFSQKKWSAMLDANGLITNKPMTTVNAPLNLGDVDAVWSVFTANAPGDNYMVFDNYQITAEPAIIPPVRLDVLGNTVNGPALLRITGQSGNKYAVEASSNLISWTSLKTNLVVDASFDFIDSGASAFSRRYYRARLVP